MVVDGEASSTGHPILIGGPQAGYFDPQILVENELHGDRIHARGAGFPGMGFVVIGRNANAAWTPTAGGSDMIDIYVEELCDPSGGSAQRGLAPLPVQGKLHRDGSPRAPRPRRDTARSARSRAAARIIVERTVHGTVVGRGRIGDKAVAVSRKRSTYMKELDSAICILRLNRNQTPNGEAFVRDFTRSMNLSTNWAYANANQIAYVHGGLYPVRPPGAHPDLPLWGTGNYEWQQDPGLASVARIKDPATDNDDVYLSDLASARAAVAASARDRARAPLHGELEQPPGARLGGRRRKLGLLERLPGRPARRPRPERDLGRSQDQPDETRADHGARGSVGPARDAHPPRSARDPLSTPTRSARARRR